MGSGGDSTLNQSEEASAKFQQTLQSTFQAQYAQQQKLMSVVTPQLENMVTKPQGMTPANLAATRTNATDVIAAQTQNAQKAAGAAAARGGGAALPSGVAAQVSGGIAAAGAEETAATQNQITMSNENLKLQNYWRGISGLTGQEQIADPTKYASEANQAGSTTAGLGQAALAAKQAGIQDVGAVMSGLGGLATGAGSILTGMNT